MLRALLVGRDASGRLETNGDANSTDVATWQRADGIGILLGPSVAFPSWYVLLVLPGPGVSYLTALVCPILIFSQRPDDLCLWVFHSSADLGVLLP